MTYIETCYIFWGSAVPRMTAKIDAKSPKVKENGAAITSAWVFMSRIYKMRVDRVNMAKVKHTRERVCSSALSVSICSHTFLKISLTSLFPFTLK